MPTNWPRSKARGGMFAQLCADLPWTQELSEVWRMRDPEERTASLALRDGGPAPVRRFLPHLIDLVIERRINPGRVFDLQLPLADVAEGYRAMDERRAIKTLLRV